MSALTKPQLVRLFEAIAAVMELNRGLNRLELFLDDGHLRQWTTHYERNGHAELGRFDDVVELLISRLRLVVLGITSRGQQWMIDLR